MEYAHGYEVYEIEPYIKHAYSHEVYEIELYIEYTYGHEVRPYIELYISVINMFIY